MKVLFFGVLTEAAGTNELEMETIFKNTTVLKAHLLSRFPALEKYDFKFAVNEELVNGEVLLQKEDEIALLPPYAGG